jgi:hypothetical protein
MQARRLPLPVVFVVAALAAPSVPQAIPAFARKYETSCLTCHTIYPRLNPFGEAFRRGGYRFPGVDGDFVKQPTVPLGQEAQKKSFPAVAWPASIPGSVPLAIGVNGQSVWYPSRKASVPRLNSNTAGVVLDQAVAEGHVWTGAAFDDTVTIWGELTFSAADSTVDVEHAQLLLNDLFGPRHAANLAIGKGFPTLTSFGPHSSFLGDGRMPNLPVTGIYSAAPEVPLSGDPFTIVDNYPGAEVTGVLLGNLDYSFGMISGRNSSGIQFGSENVYGHVGGKVGGMRLDGEGSQGPADAMRPWAETALTVDVFGFHSREYFESPVDGSPVGDTSTTVGIAARAQAGSLELDAGYYLQRHIRATSDLQSVWADAQWAELSWVVYPWLVPAIRVERIGLRPTGARNVSDIHVMPGVALLLRPNVKAVLVANIEAANGFPGDAGAQPLAWSGGNADWGGFVAAPRAGGTLSSRVSELESVALFLAWAN